MTSGERPSRALIITALPLESAAVLRHLTELREDIHPKGTIYQIGTFKALAGTWEIAVVMTGLGNARAAQETERAIAHFQPELAMFVGVAGGRKDVQLGDVVAAEKVYGYESGKETMEGLLARPDVFHSSYRLCQRALTESNRPDWRARIEPSQRMGEPKLFVKPIASGEKLITSTQSLVAEFLGRNYGDAVAVEMEGYGFAKALHANTGIEHLVVRGISDCLDDKSKLSDAADQERAAANAAAFAFEVLNKFEAPRTASSEGTTSPTSSTGSSTSDVVRELGDIRLVITNLHPEHGRVEALLKKLLAHPATQPLRDRSETTTWRLNIEFHPSTEEFLSVRVELKNDESRKDEWMTLDLLLPEESQAMLAGIIEATRFVATEQPVVAVKKFLALNQDEGATDRTRNVLLDEATRLNFHHQLEYSIAIAEAVLQLGHIEPWLVYKLSLTLMFESSRLGASGNEEGMTRLRQLHADFATKAVELGAAGVEALYGVARQAQNPKIAIQFYQELSRLHPHYTTRWYWHRDVGNLYYELGDYEKAGKYYDKACELKSEYSKLYRWAGDAYYYQGEWTEAAQRFRKALSLEPMERYFIEPKLTFCEHQLSRGHWKDQHMPKRKRLAPSLTKAGTWLLEHSLPSLATLLFWLSVRLSPFEVDAAKALAWRANQQGHYEGATRWLLVALASRPENPFTLMNVAVNLLILNNGTWNELSRKYAEAALFHGGPQMVERLQIQLINTNNREQLVTEFRSVLLEKVRTEREEWTERQLKLLTPERFGGIEHWEVLGGL